MGMTIDDAIETLLDTRSYGTADIAKSVAIDTMRKYQKIEQIVKEWRESGLLQDKFYDLINEVIKDENN